MAILQVNTSRENLLSLEVPDTSDRYRPKEAVVYVIYPRFYEAEPIKPKGITYTTASEGSM